MRIADLRNVVIVGSPGVQVTDFCSALLPDGATSGIGTRIWRDAMVTLIEAPRETRLATSIEADLRAADSAMFVISAQFGLDAETIDLWHACEAIGMPRIVVVTDPITGDFDEMVAVCDRVLAGDVLPLHYPLLDDDDELGGVVDVLNLHIHDYTSGVRESRLAETEHRDLLADAHDRFQAALLDQPEALPALIASAHIHPMLILDLTRHAVGADVLLDFIVDAMPSPAARAMPTLASTDDQPPPPLVANADTPLCAEIFRMWRDAHGELWSGMRIFSGTLGEHAPVRCNDDRSSDVEEVGDITLCMPAGKIPSASAGMIVAVTGLHVARVGTTVTESDDQRRLVPLPLQRALHTVVIDAAQAAQPDLVKAIDACAGMDPRIRVDHTTNPPTLWCIDDAHANSIVDTLRAQLATAVSATAVEVRLRESATRAAEFTGPECTVRVRPLPRGAGLHITDQRLTPTGPIIGAPLTDSEITITPNDAPTEALRSCLARALDDAGCVVLEPMCRLEVTTPIDFADAVTSDVKRRRATHVTTQSASPGMVAIAARLPEDALARYAIELRTMTQDFGTSVITPEGFDVRPAASTVWKPPR